MAKSRKKLEITCPYCEDHSTFNASGYTSHCRSKHPEHYKAYMDDKVAFITKHTVGAEPATMEPDPIPAPVAENAAAPVTETPVEPAPKEQKSESFLGSISAALRDL